MIGRRELLAGAAALPAPGTARPPLVRFGRHGVSRLIVGGNPVSGNSHVSAAMSRAMRDYFTTANVKNLLARCERAGINTWQSRGDRHIVRLLHEYRLEGGRMQWIAQTASELGDIPRHIRELKAEGAMGIYHHGSATDRFWHAGKIDAARELCKAMRDAGVRVGVGHAYSRGGGLHRVRRLGRGFLHDERLQPQPAGSGAVRRRRPREDAGARAAGAAAMPDLQGVRREPALRFAGADAGGAAAWRWATQNPRTPW